MLLPTLRQDLRLIESNSSDGHCLIYDPLAHRYHEIDKDAFAIIQNWKDSQPLSEYATLLSTLLGRPMSEADLHRIIQMFDAAGLFTESLGGWKAKHRARENSRHNPATWLLHNYLFFRIPLVQPDEILKRMLPLAEILVSRFTISVIALMGLVGIYLTSREWESFTGTFLHFFSLEGAAGYIVALFFIKSMHELGHGIAARRFGCRVPTMGVAFIVLAPMLYTDVTDAWRLQSRREKLIVGAAGIIVELCIAAIAIFLWAVLPEGFWKSAAFFTATASWTSSLLINISPLMRFDGYYLLADYWGIANLQPRAFALMRWYIREWLFDLQAPCPEAFPFRRRMMVLAYAFATAVYRLFLFIGIALLVYHYAFKILGILLFLVEILWFVLRPIWSEMKVWWLIRAKIAERSRYKYSLAAAIALAFAITVPLPLRIEFPAIVEPAVAQKITAPYSGQIIQILVKNGDHVRAGDRLFQLDSPKLTADLKNARNRLNALNERYARRTADQTDRQSTMILQKEISSTIETIEGLTRYKNDLELKATIDGIVRDKDPDLHLERWVQRGEELAVIVAGQESQVRGYLPEEYVRFVPRNATGLFIPDSLLEKSAGVSLQEIGDVGASTIDIAYLTSTNGGSIAVNEDPHGHGASPVEAQYPILMSMTSADGAFRSIQRGMVLIDASPQSFLMRLVKRAASIFIRESGF